MSEQHDLDLWNKSAAVVCLLITASTSSLCSSNSPFSFWSFSFPRMMSPMVETQNDITQPDKSRECTQFTFIFISHPAPQNQAVTQWHNCAANCWQWLDIIHSRAMEKLDCCQPVFLFYWNIRLSWQKWMLPGITNEPINQWISQAAIKLMRAGWASGSRGYILGKVINMHTEQAAINKATIKLGSTSWTFVFQAKYRTAYVTYFMWTWDIFSCFPCHCTALLICCRITFYLNSANWQQRLSHDT